MLWGIKSNNSPKETYFIHVAKIKYDHRSQPLTRI